MYSRTMADIMGEIGVRKFPDFFSSIKVKHAPMRHQLDMARNYATNRRFLDAGEPGCVSADTEFLTPTGWKRIDQYQEGDLVAQFHPDTQSMSFIEPYKYIKKPCDEFYYVKPSKGLSMVLSSDHRVLHYGAGHRATQRYRVDTMETIAKTHKEQTVGFRGLFCVTPAYEGGVHTGLTEAELRVQVMTVADGSFPRESHRCTLKVKKERKKDRCRQLLESAGLEWREHHVREYTTFTYYAPIRTKQFPKDWWHLNSDEKAIILDEVRHWDGSLGVKQSFTFTSSLQEEAELVQFIAASMGHPTSMKYRRHKIKDHELDEYSVHVQGKKLLIGIQKNQHSECETITKIPSADGFMYCFQVPSTFLVLRHDGYIFTTGNCGKTFPAHIHGLLMASLGNKVVYVMPPKLIEQFEEELEDYFLGIRHFVTMARLNYPAAKKQKMVEEFEEKGWPDILFLSYDGYREFNDLNNKKKIGANQWYAEDGSRWKEGDKPFTKNGRPIDRKGYAENDKHKLLSRRGYNTFFFDEAHNLCGLDSIISRSVEESAQGDTAIYLMTGTPVPTTISDAYGLIRLVNPEAYASQSAFERQHIRYRSQRIPHPRFKGRSMEIKVPDHYVNTEKIHEALFKNARRIQKRDIHDMPEPLIADIKVKLSGAHLKLYREVMNNHFALLGDTILAPEHASQVRHMGLQLISCPTSFNPDVPMKNELFLRTQDLVESIGPQENKIIVFAYYKAAIEFLREQFAHLNPAVLYGETTNGHQEVTRFKNDDNCRMIILNWMSGGAGLNLQVSSNIIFYECPTSPKDAVQAIARADRTGQQNLVNVYFMRVLGTLSDKNFKKLLSAEEDVNKVVHDKLDLLHEVLG